MEEKLFRILKKVYYKKAYVKDADGYQIKLETGDKFDCDTMTSFYSTDLLSLDELSYLQQSNYPLNDILYDTIRHAPEDECVSKPEQRIKKAKLIPKCDKYKLWGLLITLSELGVMPNPSILPLYEGFTEFLERCNIISSTPGNPRSDIVLPLGGWRGRYGICEERFQEVFSRFL